MGPARLRGGRHRRDLLRVLPAAGIHHCSGGKWNFVANGSLCKIK